VGRILKGNRKTPLPVRLPRQQRSNGESKNKGEGQERGANSGTRSFRERVLGTRAFLADWLGGRNTVHLQRERQTVPELKGFSRGRSSILETRGGTRGINLIKKTQNPREGASSLLVFIE